MLEAFHKAGNVKYITSCVLEGVFYNTPLCYRKVTTDNINAYRNHIVMLQYTRRG